MRSLTPTEARTRQQSSLRWPNDPSPAPSKWGRWSQGVPTVLGDCAANATNSPQQLRACNDNRAPPLKKKHHHHRRSDRQTPGGGDTPDNRRQVSDRASLTPTPHATQKPTNTTTLGTDTTYPHTPTSEPQPTKSSKRSSPRSTTNPKNTSTRQHQQKSANTTHNHTTTALHFKLEHGDCWIRRDDDNAGTCRRSV